MRGFCNSVATKGGRIWFTCLVAVVVATVAGTLVKRSIRAPRPFFLKFSLCQDFGPLYLVIPPHAIYCSCQNTNIYRVEGCFLFCLKETII